MASQPVDQQLDYKLAQLQSQVCSVPLLRTTCMLSLAGQLTQGQTQGIVSLLGGICSSSMPDHSNSSTSCSNSSSLALLLPEPASLSELRHKHGISLGELAVAMLWFDPNGGPSMATQLLAVFGPDQLPSIAHLAEVFAQGDPDEPVHYEQLQMQPILWEVVTEFAEPYYNWVQATLLKVIDEVLGLHQCSRDVSCTTG
jgi:hypothetical protein